MAVSLLGSWTQQLGANPSHAIEAGSDRLFVICFCHSTTAFPNEISSVTMGGQALTKLVGGEVINTIAASGSIWWANETTIAAMTDGNITLTAPGGVGNIISDHAFFGGVDQTTPWEDSDVATGSAVTNLSPPAISTVNNGILVASAASNGSAGTTTWSNATEISDSGSLGSPSGMLSSATANTTGSAITVTATKSVSANRLIVVAGSLRPAAGGGGGGPAFANPFGLLGVGRAA